ncbi:NADPH:quinone reductase-like Zn-dependent oxidoreductase [Microbacterium terrae]|uniref:Mycocerosic acid synthase n=1 Tax=Microbacterium terrae TaxID=69369 RepID=A0A0M2HFG3_9MICO|nr:NAD(P)-dependent alcohol dehydrogenase [Microbacterium terrae]KJL42998.1 Mycocerosic acid synthase [Microbacterium terrae]MBP1079322.1 NADPH:quinone reductase-like Zn-dependent oxidoreductase [Microbacterium terrae]GLJ98722.1 NADPH:quinone reductase [Microbacterium terrae]
MNEIQNQATDAAPGAVPQTMTAWRQERYGGPESVTRQSGPVPVPGKGQVLLRVRATALAAGDVKVMRGEPLVGRAAFGLRRPKQPVRGLETAGTVVALGPGVAGLAVGDEVVGELSSLGGGLAEYAVTDAARLVPRPVELDPVVASTLPVSGVTAWQALDRGEVGDGDRVLVLRATGGVGTFAVQLARLRGADVHAFCGEANRALVEGLGASRTWDYRVTDAAGLPPGQYDVVIDIAGTASLRDLQRLVRDGGRVVLVSGEGSRFWGPIARLAGASVRSIGSKRRLLSFLATSKTGVLADLVALAVDGRVTPVVEGTWPLAEAGAALARTDSGRAVGKTVVLGSARIDPPAR